MKTIVLFFFLISTLIAQPLSNERATEFINASINDSDSLETFVLPEELSISIRLGIEYEEVKYKFMISYDIPSEIKNEEIDYSLNVENLDNEYSILHFEVPVLKYITKYYFQNGYLISPPYFYYKDWQKIESEHFIFYLSEPEYFNQYSVDMLEKFITENFSIMNYTEEEIQLLKENKIIYILCRDEDEIEKLTGYKARGMCNLAYDYLITTYNCHYHELVHLLVNYKLKRLPLYTHPFLQEGLAVALGGRGGKEPSVILNLGQFIAESGFLEYNELLVANNFKNYDASMSYPLSGIYNKFLLESISFNDYQNLYRKYSSTNISAMVIAPTDLSGKTEWDKFVNEYSDSSITINFHEDNFKLLTQNGYLSLKENDDYYLVSSKGSFLISTPDKQKNYGSKIFQEFYPDQEYLGEEYLIRINDNEIAIYNLFTNNLIANYVSGFTLDMKLVPHQNGYYKFCIRKDIFDEEWGEWQIIDIEDK